MAAFQVLAQWNEWILDQIIKQPTNSLYFSLLQRTSAYNLAAIYGRFGQILDLLTSNLSLISDFSPVMTELAKQNANLFDNSRAWEVLHTLEMHPTYSQHAFVLYQVLAPNTQFESKWKELLQRIETNSVWYKQVSIFPVLVEFLYALGRTSKTNVAQPLRIFFVFISSANQMDTSLVTLAFLKVEGLLLNSPELLPCSILDPYLQTIQQFYNQTTDLLVRKICKALLKWHSPTTSVQERLLKLEQKVMARHTTFQVFFLKLKRDSDLIEQLCRCKMKLLADVIAFPFGSKISLDCLLI